MIREKSPLIKYLPADYFDTISNTICNKDELTPSQLIEKVFVDYPWWVNMLMKLRNQLVKPLGLKKGEMKDYISDMIKSHSDREIVLGMADKHLDFYVEFWCSPKENNVQNIAVTTIVKYNNRIGRIYFFFVKPFHKIIVNSIVRKL